MSNFNTERETLCPICLNEQITDYTVCCHGYCSTCINMINICAICRTDLNQQINIENNLNQNANHNITIQDVENILNLENIQNPDIIINYIYNNIFTQ